MRDTIDVTLDQQYWGVQSRAFEPPVVDELHEYAEGFVEVFTASIGATGNGSVTSTVYEGSAPYRAVTFRFFDQRQQTGSDAITFEPGLDELLSTLDAVITEQQSQSIYFRRNVKIFGRDHIHIVKPSERRYWTKTAGYNDADATIANMFHTMAYA